MKLWREIFYLVIGIHSNPFQYFVGFKKKSLKIKSNGVVTDAMKVQKKINHFRPLSRDPEWDTLKASQDPLFIVSRRLPDPTCLVCSGKRAFLALSWEDEHSQSCSPHPKCHIQAAPRVGRGPPPPWAPHVPPSPSFPCCSLGHGGVR